MFFLLWAPLTHLSSPSYQLDESYTNQTSQGNKNTTRPYWQSSRMPNPNIFRPIYDRLVLPQLSCYLYMYKAIMFTNMFYAFYVLYATLPTLWRLYRVLTTRKIVKYSLQQEKMHISFVNIHVGIIVVFFFNVNTFCL